MSKQETKLYDYEDAIEFIYDKCDLSRESIIKVLELELDYMRSIDLVEDFEGVDK